MPDWKREHIAGLEESIKFFGNANKFEREKHVVSAFLDALSVTHADSEMMEAPEPTDVRFRTGNFQVKEVMQDGRRRGDELKEALKRAMAARCYADLLVEYTPQDISVGSIVEKSIARAIDLTAKYGPKEREDLDLICYFNYLDYQEIRSHFRLPNDHSYRSLSLLSNRFAVVLAAEDTAPDFLKASKGNLKERHIT